MSRIETYLHQPWNRPKARKPSALATSSTGIVVQSMETNCGGTANSNRTTKAREYAKKKIARCSRNFTTTRKRRTRSTGRARSSAMRDRTCWINLSPGIRFLTVTGIILLFGRWKQWLRWQVYHFFPQTILLFPADIPDDPGDPLEVRIPQRCPAWETEPFLE